MGTRKSRFDEAVLTCTHNLCFKQKKKRKMARVFCRKIFISLGYHLLALKNRSILYRGVYIMLVAVLLDENATLRVK